MRNLQAAILTAVSMLAFGGAVVQAQTSCTEGRLANGQCVNPDLGETMRALSVIFAQPKISQTAIPVLPSGDLRYRYPNSLIPDPLKPSSTGSLVPAPGGGTVVVIIN